MKKFAYLVFALVLGSVASSTFYTTSNAVCKDNTCKGCGCSRPKPPVKP